MTWTVEIRTARSGDAPDIAKVHVETWRDIYAGLVPDTYLLSMNIAQCNIGWAKSIGDTSDTQEILVAVKSDRIIGFAHAGAPRKRSHPAGQQFDAELFMLYVAPDYQGQGVGRALLANTFSVLAGRGCLDAFLWVLAANPARFFYEAMGGQTVGERVEKFAGAKLAETAYGWDSLLIDA